MAEGSKEALSQGHCWKHWRPGPHTESRQGQPGPHQQDSGSQWKIWPDLYKKHLGIRTWTKTTSSITVPSKQTEMSNAVLEDRIVVHYRDEWKWKESDSHCSPAWTEEISWDVNYYSYSPNFMLKVATQNGDTRVGPSMLTNVKILGSDTLWRYSNLQLRKILHTMGDSEVVRKEIQPILVSVVFPEFLCFTLHGNLLWHICCCNTCGYNCC